MKGEVRLHIEGLLPEKLIERATVQGIRFAELHRPDERTLTAWLSARDAHHMIKLCRRFAIPVRVTRRRGGSAVARALRARWTLIPGLAFGALLAALFLSRIWVVDIAFTGSAAACGVRTDLEAPLQALGVRPGMSRGVDSARLCAELLAETEGYSYVGARLEGIRLLIEAAPEVRAPDVYDPEAARDLYAERAGIVQSVNVESGESCVKPGDAVRRGQLVIRAQEQATQEETRGIAARGQVTVRAWIEGRAEGSLTARETRLTGRTAARATLVTPWFQAPIVHCAPFESQSETVERIPVGGLFLPVYVERCTLRETCQTARRVDRTALTRQLDTLAMADARARLARDGPAAFEPARSWIRYTTENGVLRAVAVYEITTDAARTREELLKGGQPSWTTSRTTIPSE